MYYMYLFVSLTIFEYYIAFANTFLNKIKDPLSGGPSILSEYMLLFSGLRNISWRFHEMWLVAKLHVIASKIAASQIENYC